MSLWINVTHMAVHTPYMHENVKQMYVYFDIVEPQVVGSNAFKLLRVVPREGEKVQEQTRWEPIRAEYLKLSKKHFDTIDIHIQTPLGTVMPFLIGKSFLKFHLRKVY